MEEVHRNLQQDLGDAPVAHKGHSLVGKRKHKRKSKYAMKVDRWSERRGDEFYDEIVEAGSDKGVTKHAATDFFQAAYDWKPTVDEDCEDPQRLEYMREILSTPEYHALHASTRLRSVPATLAAQKFLISYVEYVAQEESCKGDGGGHWSKKSKKDDGLGAANAAAGALSEATKEVDEYEETSKALGWGRGVVAPGKELNTEQIRNNFKKIREDMELRKIMELAGRYRRVAQGRQRAKSSHGQDDVVGIELEGEISNLVYSELASLAHPLLKYDLMRRICERSAMCDQRRDVEKKGKGPIIVTVDESGSMHGNPVHHAKALALALAWVANHEDRWCAMVAYSGEAHSGVTNPRILPMPNGKWEPTKLIEWLSEFISGGCAQDVPIREMPDIYEKINAPKGKTDLIMITDAYCRFSAADLRKFNNWKTEVEATVNMLIVNGEQDAGSLEEISDHLHFVSGYNHEEDAIGKILSI